MKSNKGITLIALILTIIVMLILVAATISIVVQNGILNTAKMASLEYRNEVDSEKNYGEEVVFTINGVTYNSIEEYRVALGLDPTEPNPPRATGLYKPNGTFIDWETLTSGDNPILTVQDGMVTAHPTLLEFIAREQELQELAQEFDPDDPEFDWNDPEVLAIISEYEALELEYNEYFETTIDSKSSALEGQLVIEEGVTSIGSMAFAYCAGLTAVEIPSSVTSIGQSAFYCSSLPSIVIPSSVTSIEQNAFAYCAGLTAIVIPDSIESIGNGAFNECDALETVLYTGTQEEWEATQGSEHSFNRYTTIFYNFRLPLLLGPYIIIINYSESDPTYIIEYDSNSIHTWEDLVNSNEYNTMGLEIYHDEYEDADYIGIRNEEVDGEYLELTINRNGDRTCIPKNDTIISGTVYTTQKPM